MDDTEKGRASNDFNEEWEVRRRVSCELLLVANVTCSPG
jgi:hypothetical protein